MIVLLGMFEIIKLRNINLKIAWDWVVEPIFRDAYEIFKAVVIILFIECMVVFVGLCQTIKSWIINFKGFRLLKRLFCHILGSDY